jgi:hypothetical protein
MSGSRGFGEVAMHVLADSEKGQAACEACYLLNWAIGDLRASAHLFESTRRWEQLKPVPSQAIMVSRRMILMNLVIVVYRLKEVREQLIANWLLSETELQSLGFPPIDEAMGWGEKSYYFETLRGQFAGHSFAKKATRTKPGRIISPDVLGKALHKTGLLESGDFLKSARALVPGIEKVRDKLSRLYPEVKQFLKDYSSELERGAT